MGLINKQSRMAFQMIALEQYVDKDSDARAIDNFVDLLDLAKLGFRDYKDSNGRPAYPADVMVKLFLYGYMNGIRSTRKLAKACKINLELKWLLCDLTPSYRTIGDFRKNNAESFENVFKQTIHFAILNDLIEGKTLAFDSFPVRASNSKKNNYKNKKLDFLKEHAQEQLNNYIDELAKDDTYTVDEQDGLSNKIDHYESQLDKYDRIEAKLEEDGVNQVSYTDPDARILPKGDFGNFLGYRIQCGADERNKIVCGFDVCNENDINQGYKIAKQSKDNIGAKQIDGLYDKGYHSGPQMGLMDKEGITCFISIPRTKDRGVYPSSEFKYNKSSDSFICPAGQELTTNGTIFKRKKRTIKNYSNSKACRACDQKLKCTTRKQGRLISKYDHFEYVDANRKRVEASPGYYRKRSQIIEHIFGTIKRHWGLDHTILRTKEKVRIEYAIAFSCYNLKRITKILGQNGLNSTKLARVVCWSKTTVNNKIEEIIIKIGKVIINSMRFGAYRPV